MTLEFVTDVLARFGVAHTLLDAGDVAALPDALRPETRLVLSESPTNPYLSCIDLESARGGLQGAAHGEVDDRRDLRHARSTAARRRFGIDLVVHSATKYLAGHNDVLAGVVCGPGGPGLDHPRSARRARRRVRSARGVPRRPRASRRSRLRVERQNATALAARAAAREAPARRARLLPGPRRRTRATPSRARRCAASAAS